MLIAASDHRVGRSQIGALVEYQGKFMQKSPFLLNGWYCAGWSEELDRQKIIGRRLLNMPIVIYRADGQAVALHDRCPHRFAPLSKGAVKDGNLVCGYHGLAFSRTGQCVESPFGDRKVPNAAVQAFPVVERDNAIWFWPGDPELADPAAIPEFAGLGDAKGRQGYLNLKANYQLAIDNLMDLSHIEFVHLRTFGGAGCFFEGQHETRKVSDTEIWSLWTMDDVQPPAPARAAFGDQRVNHWQDMCWRAPSNLSFDMGLVPLGLDRSSAPPRMQQAHLLTPETETSTHYFYSKEQQDEPKEFDMLKIAFEEEDAPMMEACQRNMGDNFWAERPVVLATDASAILVRRMLDKMIREQNSD
jgi:phenylpropionate dioxygenase-like ring-hydroxylating dioxygenase large terminal subunit